MTRATSARGRRRPGRSRRSAGAVGGADLDEAGARLSAMTSGTRKPPPISTSSPRETATPRSRARAARTSSTAAAQLLTTIAASAPHGAGEQGGGVGRATAASPGREVELEVGVGRPPGRCSSGARPRLVCRRTPVALITGWSRVRASAFGLGPGPVGVTGGDGGAGGLHQERDGGARRRRCPEPACRRKVASPGQRIRGSVTHLVHDGDRGRSDRTCEGPTPCR